MSPVAPRDGSENYQETWKPRQIANRRWRERVAVFCPSSTDLMLQGPGTDILCHAVEQTLNPEPCVGS